MAQESGRNARSAPRAPLPSRPVRGQAPARRVAPRLSPPRPGQGRAPLSLEEKQRRAAARRAAEERAREERARAREVRRFRRRRLYLLASLFAVLFTAVYFIALSAIVNRTTPDKDAVGVQIFRAGEKDPVKIYTAEETVFGGSTYLPLSALEEFVSVSQSGDHASRSLIFSGGDEISFHLGTPDCVANGVRVSLSAPAFLKDDVLYLPADFFSLRMNCFEYTYSPAVKANVLTFMTGQTPALTTRTMTSTPRVDPATIPASPNPETPAPAAT